METLLTRIVIKRMEDRLRRTAKRKGYRLAKSRVKYVHTNNQGGWQIIDLWINTVVRGENFELTLEDAAEFLKEV